MTPIIGDNAAMSKKSWPYLIAVLLIVGGSTLVALWPASPHAVEIGESAPDFALPVFSGTEQSTINLRDYRGHVVLVNFWATWCPPCVEETPSLEKFAEQVRPLGVDVVGVSVNQNAADLQKFVTEYHLSFIIARDPLQTLSHRYGTYQFPETYILDRQGRLASKIISNIDWEDPRILSFVRDLAQPGKS
ncbi:MAG TPA: TlpA disulfide reductase family protein [Terriglobia bacterium]|nr:TlpA disulfide reductase family protein [Terriglobia bacterium]